MAAGERPRLFEYLVYGLALLLAAFVAYQALRRALPGRPGSPPAAPSAGTLLPAAPGRLVGASERSVSELPPIETDKKGASLGRGALPPPAPGKH